MTNTKLLDFSVNIAEMSRMRQFLQNVAAEADFTDRQTKELRLAVEEAVANVVDYSGATIMRLSAIIGETAASIIITDDGKPFDPTQVPPPDFSMQPEDRPAGGLGITYMRSMTDEMTYRRQEGMNILTLTKKRKK